MFDLKNLDRLFNDNSLNKKLSANEFALLKQRKIARLIKIGFPAISAALIGVLAILPSLQERNDFSIQISKPTRQELEKLHMENTVLYVTDKANRVNSITVENIDETAPRSQLVKINNPKGKFPTSDDTWIDVTAPYGFYDQNSKKISLKEDITAVYSDGTTARTSEMFYDSQAAKAYGNQPVRVQGTAGTLNAEGFEYYTDSEKAVFLGKAVINAADSALGAKTDIFADKKIEFYRSEQKMIAIGNALIIRQGMTVKGEILTAVFAKSDNGKNQISDFEGHGNVSVDNGKNKVYADNLKTFFKKNNKDQNNIIDRIEMSGHVKTKTNDGEVYADKGVYYPQSAVVKLSGNVIIVKNGNKMQSSNAETNLNTGITKIGNNGKNRVSGIIYEDSLSKEK